MYRLLHKGYSWYRWNLVYSWDLVWWNSYSFYIGHLIPKERALHGWFCRRKLNDIAERYLTTALHIFVQVWMNLSSFLDDSFMSKQKVWYSFSHKFVNGFGWSLESCFNMLVCWSSFLIYFAQWIFRTENSTMVVWWNILLTLANELVSLKVGMMIDTSKLCSLIWVQMTLTFNQGHRAVRKLETCAIILL